MTQDNQSKENAEGALARRQFLSLTAAGGLGLVAAGELARQGQASAAPVAASGAATQATAASAGRKPNILVIVADDLGYADLSIQSPTKDIPTPNIDSLANGGVRFTQGYVSCPVCSPTRAGLLTGRYQQRYGHEVNPGPKADRATFGLPLSEITLADVLKKSGYSTGIVGKWHLGFQPEHDPTKRGFDEFFGFLPGAHSYDKLQPNGDSSIYRGTEPVDEKEYLTDAFSREAESFINRHKSEPFFLYLAYNAVHLPLEPHPRYADRFPGITDERRRKYAGLLTALDDGVGRVLSALRANGLEEDTLIFFISDNGGPEVTGSTNTPLRGWKATLFEGGIRIPYFIRWKGHLPEGVTYEKPVISLDILPTAAAAAGAALPGDRVIDGANLLPHITGHDAAHPHEYLFWRMGDQSAVRSKDWKIVKADTGVLQRTFSDASPAVAAQLGKIGETFTGFKGEELYNLTDDIAESKDRQVEAPEALKELREAFAQWEKNTVPPAWAWKA